MLSRNVGSQLPIYVAQCPGRSKVSFVTISGKPHPTFSPDLSQQIQFTLVSPYIPCVLFAPRQSLLDGELVTGTSYPLYVIQSNITHSYCTNLYLYIFILWNSMIIIVHLWIGCGTVTI